MKNPRVYGGVFVRGPDGKTVLVFDETRRNPAWKFPGGSGEFLTLLDRWETPAETASRELYEETGLVAPGLTLLKEIDQGDHLWFLFEARVDNFDGLIGRGNDGEHIAVFPESRILEMPNFLSQHKEVTRELIDGKILNFAVR